MPTVQTCMSECIDWISVVPYFSSWSSCHGAWHPTHGMALTPSTIVSSSLLSWNTRLRSMKLWIKWPKRRARLQRGGSNSDWFLINCPRIKQDIILYVFFTKQRPFIFPAALYHLSHFFLPFPNLSLVLHGQSAAKMLEVDEFNESSWISTGAQLGFF